MRHHQRSMARMGPAWALPWVVMILSQGCGQNLDPGTRETKTNKRSVPVDIRYYITEELVLPPEGSTPLPDSTSSPSSEGEVAATPDVGIESTPDGVTEAATEQSTEPAAEPSTETSSAPTSEESGPQPVLSLPPETGGTTPPDEPTGGTPESDTSNGPSDTPGEEPVLPPQDVRDVAEDGDRTSCAKEFGVASTAVHFAGHDHNVNIEAGSVIYVKVTGSHNVVNLDLQGDPGVSIAGLCVFLAGNRPTINISAGVSVGRIVYIGRGNQSQGHIQVHEGCQVGSVDSDLAGNQSHLTVEGDGNFTCRQTRNHGNRPRVDCLD